MPKSTIFALKAGQTENQKTDISVIIVTKMYFKQLISNSKVFCTFKIQKL
ncbi:hypothetical protein HJ01_01899 [Flavobacterium frigoris PS1]|uniref:Uncharacterized protein n=1 Tax=Flavobacterium frigoris (strain PS1) TaxID=1086011 RepID=H7FTC3_FLAFP|nr:hypothetical protein HJ01_01899 [Flavobacterium frigoris PS1]